MTRRRKAFIACALLSVAAGALWKQTRPPPPALAFTGWTNIAGVRHAMFRFPPVLQTEAQKNFLYRTYSRLRVDFVWEQADGSKTTGSHQEIVGGPPGLATEVIVPIPGEAVSLSVTAAHLWLVRRWDNLRLPVDPPSSHWTLSPPEVTSPGV